MKNLISMTDFVLELGKTNQIDLSNEAFIDVVLNYANFLKKPLTLGMFLPVDGDGNVLEEPREDDYSFYTHKNISVHEEYSEAKERCLFDIPNLDDLETIKKCIKGETIEMLADGTLTLTPYALKQIGLN